MTYRADLHCHSTCSDGSLTPQELLLLAKEQGLAAIAITDHDTLAAYTSTLSQEAHTCGVKLFLGAEFSAVHRGSLVHLIGYGMEQTPQLLAFCTHHSVWRRKRASAILQALRRLGIEIPDGELETFHTHAIGRLHIAQLLVNRGAVTSTQEAFDRFLGEGKSCFIARGGFTPEETIQNIHQAQGKAFIAHPHTIKRKRVLTDLLAMPFDGIECYYSHHHHSVQPWLDIAHHKGWLVSGGSDFHGAAKPRVSLGCSWTSEEDVRHIFGTS